jgi:hypothetical protein
MARPVESDYTSQVAYTRALERYCDTLAQPKQEPVAWAIYDKRGGSKSLHWPKNHSPNGDATKFDAVPLYVAPQPRPWVGLTDDEISATSKGHIVRSTYARAIEAALKEKNFD